MQYKILVVIAYMTMPGLIGETMRLLVNLLLSYRNQSIDFLCKL